MNRGPLPNSSSPPSATVLPATFGSVTFNSSSSSPPQEPFAQPKPMSADVLSATHAMSSHPFGLSPIGERRPMDQNSSSLLSLSKLEQTASNSDIEGLPAILMRKLPRNTSLDVLRTMLLFAKDMVDVRFVDAEYSEDAAYISAVARFMSLAGANEAKDKLNGKAISNDAKLLVELFQSGIGFPVGRRNTVDGTSLRHASSSASSTASSGAPLNTGRQSSRFNNTFQSMEKMSPPNGSLGSDKLPAPESNAHIQSLFSPQSPLANQTISSKSMINDDPGDETGKLLTTLSLSRRAASPRSFPHHVAQRIPRFQVPDLQASRCSQPPIILLAWLHLRSLGSSPPALVFPCHRQHQPSHQMERLQYQP